MATLLSQTAIAEDSDIVIPSEARNLLFAGRKKQILRPEPAPSVVEGALRMTIL
jgi:hypothetical protein